MTAQHPVQSFTRRHRRGASMTGYALLVGLIAILALGSITLIGDQISALFGATAERMAGATTSDISEDDTGSGDPEEEPPSGSTEETPDNFSFTDIEDAAPNFHYFSEIVPITGLAEAAQISIAGEDGNPLYRICQDATCSAGNAGSFTSAVGAIENGEYVQLRMQSGENCATHSTSLTIGTVSADWSLTDLGCVGVVGHMQGEELLNAPARIHLRSSDMLAFIASQGSGGGLTVVDVSDPTDPVLVSQLWGDSRLSGLRSMARNGNLLYFAVQGADRVTIVDITDPAEPEIISSVQNGTSLNDVWDIVLSDDANFAYVTARLGHRVTVVDVSDPNAPFLRGSVQSSTQLQWAVGIGRVGNTVFAASSGSTGQGIAAVNISDPDAPTITSHLPLAQSPTILALNGSNLFTSLGSSTPMLGVVDVSNPASMSVTATLATPSGWSSAGNTFGLALSPSGDRAYLTSFLGKSLAAVDVSNPAAPVGLHYIKSDTLLWGPFDVAVYGGYAYTVAREAHGLTIIDVSALESP